MSLDIQPAARPASYNGEKEFKPLKSLQWWGIFCTQAAQVI
jgi:hypothetical protein